MSQHHLAKSIRFGLDVRDPAFAKLAWRGGEEVTRRSAKPLYTGPIPVRASPSSLQSAGQNSHAPVQFRHTPQMIGRLFHSSKGLLLLIFLLGLFFRLYHLGKVPFGFHDDELFAGYVGRYMLLHGGIDIAGHHFPLAFDRFGDFRATGIFWLSGLSTFLFGINEFAVRFPSALFGALTIVVMFGIVQVLFKDQKAAVSAALVTALAPWHIVLSRATSEGIIGLFWAATGIYSIVRFCQTKKSMWLVFSFLFCSISYLFYHPFRVLVPLFILPFFWSPILKSREKKRIGMAVLALGLLSAFLLVSKSGSGRFNQVFFTRNEALQHQITAGLVGEGPGHVVAGRMFDNKPITYAKAFVSQYLAYYSPEFLFIQGGKPDRYVVPLTGLFPYVFIPLLIVGVGSLLFKPTFEKKYVLFLLAIASIPAAVTYDDIPNVHRSVTLFLPFAIIIGIGASELLMRLRRVPTAAGALLLGMLVLSFETVLFWHQYEVQEKSYKSYFRNDMFREATQALIAEQSHFDKVYVTGYRGMPLYYLFYAKNFSVPPQAFDKGNVGTVGNITFDQSWCPNEHLKDISGFKSLLVVTSGDCKADSRFDVQKVFTQSDGATAFRFLTLSPAGNK